MENEWENPVLRRPGGPDAAGGDHAHALQRSHADAHPILRPAALQHRAGQEPQEFHLKFNG